MDCETRKTLNYTHSRKILKMLNKENRTINSAIYVECVRKKSALNLFKEVALLLI